MAVRLGNGNNYLTRTTTVLNYNAAYTWMTWYRPRALPAGSTAHTILHATFNGWPDDDSIQIYDPGTGLTFYLTAANNFAFDQEGGGTPVADTWYHITMRRNTASSLDALVNGVVVANVTQSVSSRTAAARMLIGAWMDNDSLADGDVERSRAWTRDLSDGEVATEMASADVVSATNLWANWPLTVHTDLTDHSGNGRNLTGVGTLTTEDGPTFAGGSVFVPQVLTVGGQGISYQRAGGARVILI